MTRLRSLLARLSLALPLVLLPGLAAPPALAQAADAPGPVGGAPATLPELKLPNVNDIRLQVPRPVQAIGSALGYGRQRLALVVGMGKLGSRLAVDSAPRDAQAMAAALRAGGFIVMLREDLGAADLRQSLAEFHSRLQPGGIGFAYFTGLGAQLDGQNLLLPRDLVLDGPGGPLPARLKAGALPLQDLVDALQGTADSPRMLVVDAAYQSPALAGLPKPGLTEQKLPPGMMALFSHAPGAVQDVPAVAPLPEPLPADPREVAASRFARVLVGALTTPRISGPDALRGTAKAIADATLGLASPWVAGDTESREDFAEATLLDGLLPRTPEDFAREAGKQIFRAGLRSGGAQAGGQAVAQALEQTANPASTPAGATTSPASPPPVDAAAKPPGPTAQPQPPDLPPGSGALGSAASAAGSVVSAVGTAAGVAAAAAGVASLATGAQVAATSTAVSAATTAAGTLASGVGNAVALGARLGSGSQAEQPAQQAVQQLAAATSGPSAAPAAAAARANAQATAANGVSAVAEAPTAPLPAAPLAPAAAADALQAAAMAPARTPARGQVPEPDGRTSRAAEGGERPVYTPRTNKFGYAEGDTFTYQVVDTWKDQVIDSFTQSIEEVLDDGQLLANGQQLELDQQGRIKKQRRPDGSVSQFEPVQDLWWSSPKVGQSRSVRFTEHIQRASGRHTEIEFKGSSSVGRLKKIETPAGKFEALPIATSGWFYETLPNGTLSSGQFSRTVWYAPQLGHPVAMDIEDADRLGKLLRRERIELMHAQQMRNAP